jgi:DNA-binding CsgD family transcriptional regulator
MSCGRIGRQNRLQLNMRRHSRNAKPADISMATDDPLAAGPHGLEAHTFTVGPDDFVVFSFPLADRVLPDHLMTLLTPAEREVANLLIGGANNSAVAKSRRRSLHTVVNQIASIYRKLNINSRSELMRLAG